jgi:hypothetical protein
MNKEDCEMHCMRTGYPQKNGSIGFYTAISYGDKYVIQWFYEKCPSGCDPNAIDYAAAHSNLETVKFLHDLGAGATTEAMDVAAAFGRLDLVKWLQTNRKEGCTTRAMDNAVQNNNYRMVIYLHEQGYTCTPTAMIYAVATNFTLVKWLNKNIDLDWPEEILDLQALQDYPTMTDYVKNEVIRKKGSLTKSARKK